MAHDPVPVKAARRGITELTLTEKAGPPTPGHWRERVPGSTSRQDFWLGVVTGHLGEPVGRASLQDGRIFNDILPISGEEKEQTGHGSQADLELHIENCFSDERCDALALLCLRRVVFQEMNARKKRLPFGQFAGTSASSVAVDGAMSTAYLTTDKAGDE